MSNARIHYNPLDGYTKKEALKIIQAAALGVTDKKIAKMYFINRLSQEDIASEVCLERSSVSRRLKNISHKLTQTHIFSHKKK